MIRRVLPQVCVMLGCLGLLAYFTYHGLYGKHGLQASHVVQAELDALKSELAELQAEKKALEHRISLMVPERLDPDMLDESARNALNFARPDELIILHPDR